MYVYKQNRQFHCSNGILQSDYIRLVKEAIKQRTCKDIYCRVVYKVQPLKSGGATIERLYKLFPRKPKKKTKDNCTITPIENISHSSHCHTILKYKRYFLNQSYFSLSRLENLIDDLKHFQDSEILLFGTYYKITSRSTKVGSGRE